MSVSDCFRDIGSSRGVEPIKISISRDHPYFTRIKGLIARLATHHETASGLSLETPQIDPDENIREFLDGCKEIAEECGVDFNAVLDSLSVRSVDFNEILLKKNQWKLGQIIGAAVSGIAGDSVKDGLTSAARVRYSNIADAMMEERYAE